MAAAVLMAACGSPSPSLPTAPTSMGSARFLSVSVQPPDLLPGEIGYASVWGWTTQNGSPIYGPLPVTAWTSSTPSVAAVTGVASAASSGLVTAIGPGTTSITATVQGAPVSGLVTVFTERDIVELQASCIGTLTLTLVQGGSCSAVARMRAGGTVQVPATWSTPRPDIVLILSGPAGTRTTLLIGLSEGQTVVTGTFRGLQAAAPVIVTR